MTKGWEVMSRFVCLLYSFKAAVKIVSKFVVGVAVDGTWDIVLVEEAWLDAQRRQHRITAKTHTADSRPDIPREPATMIDAHTQWQ